METEILSKGDDQSNVVSIEINSSEFWHLPNLRGDRANLREDDDVQTKAVDRESQSSNDSDPRRSCLQNFKSYT